MSESVSVHPGSIVAGASDTAIKYYRLGFIGSWRNLLPSLTQQTGDDPANETAASDEAQLISAARHEEYLNMRAMQSFFAELRGDDPREVLW